MQDFLIKNLLHAPIVVSMLDVTNCQSGTTPFTGETRGTGVCSLIQSHPLAALFIEYLGGVCVCVHKGEQRAS
jgi:hypothetical protein